MFLPRSLSKSKFLTRVELMSLLQHSCRTSVTLVSLVSHLCYTCVASVALVLHSSRSCRTRLARVALVSLVSGTHIVNQTRSKVAFFYKSKIYLRCSIQRVNWKKRDGENIFFKASSQQILVNIKKLFMIQQSCLWTTFYLMDFMKR